MTGSSGWWSCTNQRVKFLLSWKWWTLLDLSSGWCEVHSEVHGVYRGAAEGEGLGNAFLSNIQAVDGIMHVCRAFEDPDVTHVEDRVNPVEDLEIIHAELRAKDIERVTNHLQVRVDMASYTC